MGAVLYFLCGICIVDAFTVLQELASNIFLIYHRCRDKFEPFGNNVDLVVSYLEIGEIFNESLV